MTKWGALFALWCLFVLAACAVPSEPEEDEPIGTTSLALGALTVTTFSPTRGASGATVTINGDGFVSGATQVAFGGVPSPAVTFVNAKRVKAIVPDNAISGPISITTAAGTVTSATAFTLLPVIDSFTPEQAFPGDTITVTGAGFHEVTAVKVGTVATTFSIVDDDHLSLTVPTGVVSGKITLSTPNVSRASATKLFVLPIITSFAPTAGIPGTSVAITGIGFQNATSVVFNATAATSFTVVSDTSITAVVPTGATSGKIKVITPKGERISTDRFTVVVKPKIKSFTPTSSALPVTVTIDGSGFLETTSVTLGSAALGDFTVVSGTQITATVPLGSASGKFTVTNAAGSATSTATFGVIDRCAGVVCVASDACHVAGTCDPATGQCTSPAKPDGAACADGDACNGDETCNAGVCAPGAPPVLDDGDPCTTDACDAASGVTHTTIAGCGAQQNVQPLPAPPDFIMAQAASLPNGVVGFVDPAGVLLSRPPVVTNLGSIALGQVTNAQPSAWSFDPPGSLGNIVYAKIPLDHRVAGSSLLLWSRAAPSQKFAVQSVARVTGDGMHAVAAMQHFSQKVLAPLDDDGAAFAPMRLVASIDQTGDGNVSMDRLSVSPQRFAFMHLDRLLVGPSADTLESLRDLEDGFVSLSDDVFSLRKSFVSDPGLHRNGVLFADNVLSFAAASHGQRVAYSTLDPTTFNFNDIQLKSFRTSGPAELVSIPPDGVTFSVPRRPVISRQGRFVSFIADLPGPMPWESKRGYFLRDTIANQTFQVPFSAPQQALSLGCTCDDPGMDIALCCGVEQVPLAITDGGRYVFYVDDGTTTPVAPYENTRDPNLWYGKGCGHAYRVDRTTGATEIVGYGDWFNIDSGGRTLVSHPCRTSDAISLDPPLFRGMTVRDTKLNVTIPLDPNSAKIKATAVELHGGSYSESSFFYDYHRSFFDTGVLSADGNSLHYGMNRITDETYGWEIWSTGVPLAFTTPEPFVNVEPASILEYRSFGISYGNLYVETNDNVIVLRGPSGIVDVKRTFDSQQGTFTWPDGLPPGNYRFDVYYALDGDPITLKARAAFPFTILPQEPHLSTPNGSCEFEPTDVSFSSFLAMTMDDRIELMKSGETEPVEVQKANGQGAGVVRFETRLDEGDYTLRVRFGRPDSPGSTRIAGMFPLHVDACPWSLPAPVIKRSTGVCEHIHVDDHDNDPSTPTKQTTSFAPMERPTYVVSEDASLVAFTPSNESSVKLWDRRLASARTIATDAVMLGSSQNGRYVAYGSTLAVNRKKVAIVDITTGAVWPAGEMSSASSREPRLAVVSNDGATLAFSDGVTVYVWRTDAYQEIVQHNGCAPTMTADGSVVAYYNEDIVGSHDSRAYWVSLDHPADEHLFDLGRVGDLFFNYPTIVDALTLSPDGTTLFFQSPSNPSEVPLAGGPVSNPQTFRGRYLYAQNIDGSNRRFVEELTPDTTAELFSTRNDQIFFTPNTSLLAPGVFTWSTSAPVTTMLKAGDITGRIGVTTGTKRRLYASGTFDNLGPALIVTPY